jgi:glycosyltransferase involved in cell wall biosynthesis
VQISAIIITLNEERNLQRALDSLALVADEILVVDSGSRDHTREIAERAGARFIGHHWAGYAAQKNFAASQSRYDWLLSIDADESLSDPLVNEIQQLKRSGPGEAAGFTMPRLAQFRGRWIRHSGWYPDRKLRLYDRRRARWVGQYVHERVEAEGPVRTLKGDLLHFPCDTRAEQLRSIDRYTTLAAMQAHELGELGSLTKLMLLPTWKFLETYLLRQGFRDGREGLEIATMAGHYVCLKYKKLRQMYRGRRDREPAQS